MFKYQKLADMLKKLIYTKCQLKDLIYNQEDQSKSHSNPAVAYSNLSLILNNYDKFEFMFAKLAKKARHQKVTNKFLLFILAAQYLNVGCIKGGGKLKKIIMENLALLPEVEAKSKMNKSSVQIRLRNVESNEETEKWGQILQTFEKVPLIQGMRHLSYEDYSELMGKHPQLRKTSACVVQSWSSALPPVLLFSGLLNQSNQGKKFDVIDACSAPGNKTLQLGQFLKNRGTVHAFQKDERRFGTLCRNIQRCKASNINPLLASFLDAKPQDYTNVKLIMLDPSCSGSGMLTNFTRDSPDQKQMYEALSFEKFAQLKYKNLGEDQQNRVLSLQKFQLELLAHAATFKPQRISYSTCSIYRQENQHVVAQFLKENPDYFIKEVVKEKVEHLETGFGKKYSRCIRVDPRSRNSDGFFVCVFGKKKGQQ